MGHKQSLLEVDYADAELRLAAHFTDASTLDDEFDDNDENETLPFEMLNYLLNQEG